MAHVLALVMNTAFVAVNAVALWPEGLVPSVQMATLIACSVGVGAGLVYLDMKGS